MNEDAPLEVTTTVTHLQILSERSLSVLVTSNDIRDHFISELVEASLSDLRRTICLLRKKEWLTSFRSSPIGNHYVSRWDDTVYSISRDGETQVELPCEAITRVVLGSKDQILCTCYWGLVQLCINGKWISLDIGREVDLFCGLFDGERSFYVCGAEGTLARFDGSTWTFYDLPTDADFFGLAFTSDGGLLVCGAGIILKGLGDEWSEVYSGDTTFHFAATEGKRTFLAGGEKGLFYLEGGNVLAFDDSVYAYHCDARFGIVACCGGNSAHVFIAGKRQDLVFQNLF